MASKLNSSKIKAAQDSYNAAKAKGDTKGMAAAHSAADAARGYSTTTTKDKRGNLVQTPTSPNSNPSSKSNSGGSSGGNKKNIPPSITPAANVVTPKPPAKVVTPVATPQYDTGIQSLIDSYNAAKSKVGSASTPAVNTPKTPNTPKTIEDYQNAWKNATTQAEKDAAHTAADKLRGVSTTTTKDASGKLVQTPTTIATNVATPNKTAATPAAAPVTVKANSSGSAPSTAKVGDIVKTNGGDYKIVAAGTPGAGYNSATGLYSIKVNTTPTVTTPAATSSVTPDWLNTGANAANPTGTVSGAVTTTTYVDPNGDTKTGYIKDGHTYMDSACTTPIVAGSTVTTKGGTYTMTADGGKAVDMTGVTKTTYKDANNVPKVGYIKDGMTYTDAACTNRIPTGSTVTTADGKTYKMQETGGTVVEPTPVVSDDPAIQIPYEDIIAATNEIMVADPTLTREQALAMAYSQLNPAYNDSIDAAMSDIQNKALQTGFFGQLPTAALQMETAGKLETSKLQAINELAAQLFGESADAANTKLSAATTAQQNKIANLLSLLGIAQSERSYTSDQANTEWEKAYKEATLAKSSS